MSYTLAVTTEMLFTELPFLDRVRKLHERGLAVEIWDWTSKDIPALAAVGAQVTCMTGYVSGNLTDPDGVQALLATMEQSIPVAKELGSPLLNFHGTGLGEGGLPVQPVQVVTPAMWLTARDTCARVAELGERHGVTFVLENLNLAVDHPGTPFATAADTFALVSAVDSPHLRMNLDLYHAQIGEGNLIELCRSTAGYYAEIQVADVPGRCEPGTGEINYSAVANALRELDFDGVVGLESFASGSSEAAVDAFVAAFSCKLNSDLRTTHLLAAPSE